MNCNGSKTSTDTSVKITCLQFACLKYLQSCGERDHPVRSELVLDHMLSMSDSSRCPTNNEFLEYGIFWSASINFTMSTSPRIDMLDRLSTFANDKATFGGMDCSVRKKKHGSELKILRQLLLTHKR